jgi:hypothetical protein
VVAKNMALMTGAEIEHERDVRRENVENACAKVI